MTRILHNLAIVASSPLTSHILVRAHMQMSWPYPPLSPLDPAVPVADKDYSYTSPLLADGSNFPCKNYQLSSVPGSDDIKETYEAGNTYNLTLAGSATHDGGSCQISLSYDNGETFKVIKSIIGGCPLTPSYDFTIPSYAPSSNSALLVWSWFNIVGNREMYMNCARVAIQGSSSSRVRRRIKRQNSMADLPDMMVCNVDNGCATIEGTDVVYPNPGANVQYGTDLIADGSGDGYTLTSTPTGNAFSTGTVASPTPITTPADIAPYTNDTDTGSGPVENVGTGTGTGTGLTSTPTNSSTPPFPTLPATTNSSTPTTFATSVTPSITTGFTPTTSFHPRTYTWSGHRRSSSTVFASTHTQTTHGSSSIPSATTSVAKPSSTVLSGPCTPGSFACNSISSFSECVNNGSGTSYVYMGVVAAGMQCVNGDIIQQNAGTCTPNGALVCNGPNAFYLCNQGGLINMGPVAAGTECINGAIVAAS